jgi:hypothetical protein
MLRGLLSNLRDWITYPLVIPSILHLGVTISLAKPLFGKCKHYLIIIKTSMETRGHHVFLSFHGEGFETSI